MGPRGLICFRVGDDTVLAIAVCFHADVPGFEDEDDDEYEDEALRAGYPKNSTAQTYFWGTGSRWRPA